MSLPSVTLRLHGKGCCRQFVADVPGVSLPPDFVNGWNQVVLADGSDRHLQFDLAPVAGRRCERRRTADRGTRVQSAGLEISSKSIHYEQSSVVAEMAGSTVNGNTGRLCTVGE